MGCTEGTGAVSSGVGDDGGCSNNVGDDGGCSNNAGDGPDEEEVGDSRCNDSTAAFDADTLVGRSAETVDGEGVLVALDFASPALRLFVASERSAADGRCELRHLSAKCGDSRCRTSATVFAFRELHDAI